MSFLDKLTAAITPPESDEDRAEAHARARTYSSGNDWFGVALDHHEQIETALDAARSASTPDQAHDAMRALGGLLTAHSMAEEVALYPALVTEGHKISATEAYQEQQLTKVQMAELEKLPPLGEEWVDKLEHIRGAVLHHIYQEESDWFPQLAREASPEDQAMMSRRFVEEYQRYMASV